MDKDIVVGLLVGLATATTIFFLSSPYFTKNQKIILGVLLLFPPGQWFLGLVFWGYNSLTSNLPIHKIDGAEKNLNHLKTLNEKGLLTNDEFEQKKSHINSETIESIVKGTPEFKSLKLLKKNGILSEVEFNSKFEEIKKRYLKNQIDDVQDGINFTEPKETIEPKEQIEANEPKETIKPKEQIEANEVIEPKETIELKEVIEANEVIELKETIAPIELNEPIELKETNVPIIDKFNSINGFTIKLNDIATPNAKIKAALELNTFTLHYTLKNIERYIKMYSSFEYPFYVALELDKRGEILDDEEKINLNRAAETYYSEPNVTSVFQKLRHQTLK